MWTLVARDEPLVAREEPAGYDAGAPAGVQGHDGAALEGGLAASPGGDDRGAAWAPGGDGAASASADGDGASLGAAVAGLAAAIAAFDDVDLTGESDEALRAAAVELPRQVARAQARLVDVVADVDRRFAYEADGAVSAAAWLRGRVNCEAGEASRIVSAGRRLRRLPALAAAFTDGDVGLAHVTAITSAAIRQRMPAIQALESTLTELARRARPRDVRAAVATIRDLEDADGSDTPPLPDDGGPDPRRGLTLNPTIDGLCHLDALLDPITRGLK